MTSEMNKLANDPNFAVQFAVGDPAPDLVPQSKDVGIQFARVYYDTPKRYILKSAHMSREDVRIFDSETGLMVLVSHHPGKNPYEALDPLGITDNFVPYDPTSTFGLLGGEWESVCDVSATAGFQSFSIRPKFFSRHGRQYVKVSDQVILNVARMGKFKTMSLREHIIVAAGEDNELAYKCIADMMGRTVSIFNDKEEIVAQIAKTTKALILNAVFGSGSESTIDIAPGVDCSVILAIVFAMNQVGHHFLSDAFNNTVMDPMKDHVVGSAVQGVAGAFGGENEGEQEESEELAYEEPAGEELAYEEPADEELAYEEPAGEELAYEEPADEEPAYEEEEFEEPDFGDE